MYMEFADIDWIAGDYGGDYTDRGPVMRSCPILAAVQLYSCTAVQLYRSCPILAAVSLGCAEPLLIAKQNKTLININKKQNKTLEI